MITHVTIKNFKSIVNQKIGHLTPIIGIWGENGTGKSSLLQAIVWAAKNRGAFEQNGIQLDGPNLRYGIDINNECEVNVKENNLQCICKIERNRALSHNGGFLDNIRYFPPWRHISIRGGNVSEKITSDIGYRVNTIHNFLHWFLHNLMGRIARGDKEAEKTYERINFWSKKMGFGELLDNLSEQSNVIGTYKDPISDFEIPLLDGGYGGNTFLPIILECFKFKDLIILVEEPEISLHAKAQGDVWNFMMEMVNEQNHQIIFTSHSPYLGTKMVRTFNEGQFKDNTQIYLTKKTKEKGTEFVLQPNDELIKRLPKYWDNIFPELEGR